MLAPSTHAYGISFLSVFLSRLPADPRRGSPSNLARYQPISTNQLVDQPPPCPQIHAVVMDLEASMAEVGANQRHANHGIYVLCKAVRCA